MTTLLMAGVPFAPLPHRDPVEHRGDPLDLRAAAFGQVGTQLELTLRTQRAGVPRTGDELCVTLLRHRPVGQLCITQRATVRYRHAWKRPGRYGPSKRVPGAEVERRGRTITALVYPHA